MATSLYAQSFTWNGLAFTSASNGILRIEDHHSGEPLESRTGDDEYPRQVFVVNKSLRVTVACRDFKLAAAPGSGSASGVAVVKTKSGTVTKTYAALILVGLSSRQHRAKESETVLEFVHESADGVANPVS